MEICRRKEQRGKKGGVVVRFTLEVQTNHEKNPYML